jgi:hypothetical protein
MFQDDGITNTEDMVRTRGTSVLSDPKKSKAVSMADTKCSTGWETRAGEGGVRDIVSRGFYSEMEDTGEF